MSEACLPPSRRLRGATLAISMIWWGLLAAWLALILGWGALHALIVPRIEKARPWLEQQVSQRWGLDLRIGSLRAQAVSWRHLPTIELRDVSLRNAQGELTLELARVRATVSPRSLWRLGLEHLLIEQPRVTLERDVDGRWALAGLPLHSAGGSSALADWVFSQRELVLQGGTLSWLDRAASGEGAVAPLKFEHVGLLLRNQGLQHTLRLEADPPPAWGGPMVLAADLRQPLLSLHPGRWQDWQGQLYGQLARINLEQLAPHLQTGPVPMQLQAGSGQLRAWLQLADGHLNEATVDLALRDLRAQGRVTASEAGRTVAASTADALAAPLALADLSGRLVWQTLPRGYALRTEALRFQTQDGLRWSGGNARLRYQAAGPLHAQQGQFQGEDLDLHALVEVASRLPLDEALLKALRDYAPSGLVQQLDLQWRDRNRVAQRSADPADPAVASESWWNRLQWQAQGQVEGLQLAAGEPRVVASAQTVQPGRPGLSGASLSFALNQDGGRGQLSLDHGLLIFPGVFEQAALPMDALQAQFKWRRQGQQHSVELEQLEFANADAAGHARGRWQTGSAQQSGERQAAGLPGHLMLEGELTRAEGTRVHRYLPLAIPQQTRHYVRDAVHAGRASRTVFKVDSGLDHFPPRSAAEGEFRIAADLQDVEYAYVPQPTQGAAPPWPALSGLQAQLVFERNDMYVRLAKGHFAGLPELRIEQAAAQLPGLNTASALLQVQGRVAGPLAQALAYVQRSPLEALSNRVFADSRASGQATTQLALQIPLTALDAIRLQGQTQLRDASLQMDAALPALEQVQARVDFTERGFVLHPARTRFLGGELRLSGSGELASGAAAATAAEGRGLARLKLQFEGQGELTAAGLRQQLQQPKLVQLAGQLQGQTRYQARIGWRNGLLQARVESSLLGLGVQLPAPFAKAAEAALPVRLDSSLSGPTQDHIRLQLGSLLKAEFVRELIDGQVRVRRGAIGLADEGEAQLKLPSQGVALDLRLKALDLGLWQQLLEPPAAAPDGAATSSSPPDSQLAVSTPARSPSVVGAAGHWQDFVPDRVDLQIGLLQFQDRRLHQLSLQGTRQQQTWSLALAADEAAGQLAYSPGGDDTPGRLYARLKHLTLAADSVAPEQASERAQLALNDLLDRQPAALPAMDIEVEQLQLGQRKLGSLQVVAVNHGVRTLQNDASQQLVHEWELSTLALRAPEATLTAKGHWRWPNDETSSAGGRTTAPRARATELDFKLQARDAGQLLDRLGYGQLFQRGAGTLSGRLRWTGSPLALNYPTLSGEVRIDMRNGQFLKADLGLARLLGVLSLQALPRRLTLDFRDTFAQGFAFDYTRGDVQIEHGVARSNNLQMKGVSAAVLMEGQADLVQETQDLKVVVVPELNTNTMALIATAINPAVGLGTFLAQWVLQRPLLESVTHSFRIRGTWRNPDVQTIQSTRADTAAGRAVSESDAPSDASVEPSAR
jgi:uncharacterized protein (TIGR02099 family)